MRCTRTEQGVIPHTTRPKCDRYSTFFDCECMQFDEVFRGAKWPPVAPCELLNPDGAGIVAAQDADAALALLRSQLFLFAPLQQNMALGNT